MMFVITMSLFFVFSAWITVLASSPYTIGVSINALANIHNREMFEKTEAAIKAAGHTAVMVNANGYATQQALDIENLVIRGVDVILVQNGDRDALANAVREAVDSGIYVISMDAGWIPGISTEFAKNDFIIGAELYSMLAARMGYKGKVITVNHNDHPAIRKRRNLQDAILKEYAEIERVANVTSTFPGTVEVVYSKVENALTANPDVDQIWCCMDLEAIGATKAIEALGYDHIITVGVDGEEQALRIIQEGGPIIATVIADLDACAELVVEVSERLMRGEEIESFYAIPYVIVTQENVDVYLEKFDK